MPLDAALGENWRVGLESLRTGSRGTPGVCHEARGHAGAHERKGADVLAENAVQMDRPKHIVLGGIGAGGMTMGPDGWFRNITTNNNPFPGQAIAAMAHGFLAARVATDTVEYARMLRVGGPAAGNLAPLGPGQIFSRVVYPKIDYRLNDPSCPVELLWSVFSPVTAYDYEASSMPVIFVEMLFHNHGSVHADVSALVSWENICGRTATISPARPGTVTPIIIAMDDDQHKRIDEYREQALADHAHPSTGCNALEFFSPDGLKTDADGGFCLAAQWTGEGPVETVAWDPARPDLPDGFASTGGILTGHGLEGDAGAGAVCSGRRLAPGDRFRARFALSWYCPRRRVGDIEQGNGYASHFGNATEVAQHGLRSLKYFTLSTGAWRRRFTQSSMPPWLKLALTGSYEFLATHGIYTRDEAFALARSLADPVVGPMEDHWDTSLATMLLYPRLENSWLGRYGAAAMEAGSFPRSLGRYNLFTPEPAEPDAPEVLRTALFALSVYRNYLHTGNVVPLQRSWPLLEQRVGALLRSGEDGLPAPAGPITCAGKRAEGLTSRVAGLWLTAVQALGEAADLAGKQDESKFLKHTARRIAQRFEERYWDEDAGHYRFFAADEEADGDLDPRDCHIGQLAGVSVGRFLGLPHLLDRNRVLRTLGTLLERNVRDAGVLELAGNPEHPADFTPAVQLACLLMYEGRAAEGMALLERMLRGARVSEDIRCQAVWYAYTALTGLEMNVPRQRIQVAPNLPGDTCLSAPLITAWCLGDLRFQQDRVNDAFHQRLEIAFDSPITLREFEVHLPPNVHSIGGRCRCAGDKVEAIYFTRQDEDAVRVVVTPQRPLMVQSALRIDIRGATGPNPEETP